MTFVALGFVAVCLLGVLLFVLKRGGNNSDASDYKRRIQAQRQRKPPKTPKTVTRSGKEDPETEAVLNAYPIFRAIPYGPVVEGAWPMSPDRIDAGLKERIEERVSSLGPIKTNSVKLLNLLKDPSSDPREITAVVSTNPGFSAKILQSANSAYFNLPQKITSVGRAITHLGYNNVRSLVLQDALQGILPKDNSMNSETRIKIWVHSAIVSVCAGYLGKKIFTFSEYDLATMGLLHDIGKYFIPGALQDAVIDPNLPLVGREEMSYGVNHATLGSVVVRHWQLSEVISRAIGYHHHPTFLPPDTIPGEYVKYSFIICLSDLIGKLLDYDEKDSDILPLRDEYYATFDLPKDPSELITQALIKEVEKTRLTVTSYISAM
jgi:HD-like signal output (HDOD) protein